MGDYTIQISTKLVDQLARDDEKVKRKTRKPKAKKKITTREDVPTEPKPSTDPAPAPAPGWPLQPPPMLLPPVTPAPPPPPPPPQQAEMPEVEAIRTILKESEMVLEKLEKQEAGARQELSRRAKELHDREFKLPYQSPAPCAQEREGCLHCYKTNAKDPLRCAEAVKRFEACALQALKKGSAKANANANAESK